MQTKSPSLLLTKLGGRAGLFFAIPALEYLCLAAWVFPNLTVVGLLGSGLTFFVALTTLDPATTVLPQIQWKTVLWHINALLATFLYAVIEPTLFRSPPGFIWGIWLCVLIGLFGSGLCLWTPAAFYLQHPRRFVWIPSVLMAMAGFLIPHFLFVGLLLWTTAFLTYLLWMRLSNAPVALA